MPLVFSSHTQNTSGACHIPLYPTRKHCITSIYVTYFKTRKKVDGSLPSNAGKIRKYIKCVNVNRSGVKSENLRYNTPLDTLWKFRFVTALYIK